MRKRVLILWLLSSTVLFGQGGRVHLQIQPYGHATSANGLWSNVEVSMRDSVAPNQVSNYYLFAAFDDTIALPRNSGYLNFTIWRCNLTPIQTSFMYDFSTDSLLSFSWQLTDSCLIAIGSQPQQKYVHVSGQVLGNPSNGGGAWPYAIVEFEEKSLPVNTVPNWPVFSDANGYFSDSIPIFANTGTVEASVQDCQMNIHTLDQNFNLPQSSVLSLQYQLSVPCLFFNSTGPIPIVDFLTFSGYVLENNGSTPVPFAAVDILMNNSSYTVFTDGNGYYSDSIAIYDSVGSVIFSSFDCLGNVNSISFHYQAPFQTNTIDTLVVACPPNPLSCQANFSIDTSGSNNGQLVLTNSSQVPAYSGTSWLWDFGDGAVSNQAFPSHQYSQAGMYHLCLQLTSTSVSGATCSSFFCDSIGMDSNGNLIYKGMNTGFSLIVVHPAQLQVDELKASSLLLYPNPASNLLFIKGLREKAVLQLYDQLGRIHWQGSVEPNNEFYLPDLPDGLYSLRIHQSDQVQFIRLVIRN